MIRSNSTQICQASHKKCFDEARNNFEHHKKICKCLVPCNYVKYNFEIEKKWYHKNLTYMSPCNDKYTENFGNEHLSYIEEAEAVMKERSMVEWFRGQKAWINKKFEVKFEEIRTLRGMGFAFNLVNAEELLDFSSISNSFNYTRNITMAHATSLFHAPIPLHLDLSENLKFSINVKEPEIDTENYQRCVYASILVHSADFLPTFEDRAEFVEIKYGMTLNIEVTPEIIKTDDNLKSLSPQHRDCYFVGEKKLKFFKIYTQRNCEIECYTKYVYEACNCTEFEQPHNKEMGITTCPDRSMYTFTYCSYNAKVELYKSESFSIERNCSCLPTCESINYHIKYYPEYDKSNETTINLWMNTEDMILYRRYQQFTFSDVVSYVGGLLGLFAGISMLSIVEILYFFIVRIFVDLSRNFRD